jgi:hypothetical protein
MVALLPAAVKPNDNANKTNSMPLVRKRTIPTEQLLLVGEVSAWSAQRIPMAVNFGFLDHSRYFPFK